MSEINDNKDIVTFDSDETAFAVYSATDNSLTFYYGIAPDAGSTYNGKTVTNVYTGFDEKKYTGTGTSTAPPWYSDRTTFISVAFDKSFAEIQPVATAYWFYGMTNLAEITGIEYLDTSEAQNMQYMFYNCSGLTSLDLSGLDTAKVTSMYFMFYQCSSLTSLDVSNFNTSAVTFMTYMFYNCSSLTSLDVSSFDTSAVTDISAMFCQCSSLASIDVSSFDTSAVMYMNHVFYQCSNLKSLDLSSFNTSAVTSMAYMFYNCSCLTSLDVSGFNTAAVTNMSYMFRGCSGLATIYSNDVNFVTTKVTSGSSMFSSCSKLVGGNGTTYSSSNVTYTMAHVDTANNPGYFTYAEKEAFAVYSTDDNSLTFYYGLIPKEGGSYKGKVVTNVYTGFETETWSGTSGVPWYSLRTSITKVVINNSFKDVQPVSLALWFCDMANCVTIEGLEFLDTRNVTTMYRLFRYCENITYLDVSTWDTSKVTTMEQMFAYCYKLKYLDLSNFDTSNVTAMNGMLRDNTVLEELNLSGFDTSKATETNAMFRDSTNLKTIYVDSDWDLGSVSNDANMFLNCSSLVGGNGTKYDSSKVDSSMAHIDTDDNPGYFTGVGAFAVYSATDGSLAFYNGAMPAVNSTYNGKDVTNVFREFNDTIYSSESQVPWYSIRANVKSVSFDETFKSVKLVATDYWFCGFENCIEFKNFDNINTSEVESMSYMFSNCSQATYLNLSGFDTSNVTDMSGMFQYFNGFYIETSSFNTSKVTNFQQMFAYCQNIICLDVSNFNMSSAQNIEGMFLQMNNLIELSLGGWDISNVTVASNLFRDSQSLKTIRAFNDWNLDTAEDDNMFYNCQSLVGGNGTVYDPDKITGEMAKVDREETEGYFTKKYNCFCNPISYIAISKDSKKSLAAIQDRTTKAYFGISLDPNSYPSVDSTETSLLGVAKLGVAVLRCYDFWTDKIPKIQDDEYLWMRLLITNKDGTKEWSEPWLLTI